MPPALRLDHHSAEPRCRFAKRSFLRCVTLSLEVGGMNIELELEEDGRWIVEVVDLPGVMTYGKTREETISKVKALALRVLADRIEHGEELEKAS